MENGKIEIEFKFDETEKLIFQHNKYVYFFFKELSTYILQV